MTLGQIGRMMFMLWHSVGKVKSELIFCRKLDRVKVCALLFIVINEWVWVNGDWGIEHGISAFGRLFSIFPL